jgi:hypothetical protein
VFRIGVFVSTSTKASITPVEGNQPYLDVLRRAVSNRSSYNLKPEVVEAIRVLKDARPFGSETIVVGDALIEAAKTLKSRKILLYCYLLISLETCLNKHWTSVSFFPRTTAQRNSDFWKFSVQHGAGVALQ